jgi:alkylation response protein AidB-like acyl-CoA dehydrogenase
MDFSFSEEHEAIRELSRQILADACGHEHLAGIEADEAGNGYDDALWKAMGEANLLGVALGEAYGGMDLGLQALCVLLEEIGQHVAPVPALPTLAYGALPIAKFGTDAQREQWLPGVVSGDTLLSAAFEEAGNADPHSPRTRARRDGESWKLDGEKIAVPAADSAARILVAAVSDGGIGLFLLDPAADGVTLEEVRTSNYERQFAITLDGARVSPDDMLGDVESGAEILRWTLLHARTAICAMQLGISLASLRATAEYTSNRKQFGRAIGTFQAVTMRSADAYIDIDCMRSTLWQAAWRLEAGLPAKAEVATAKWWACRGGHRVAHTCMHLHGGMGADVEYPIHRFFLWSQQLQLTLGGAGQQLADIGRVLVGAEPKPA